MRKLCSIFALSVVAGFLSVTCVLAQIDPELKSYEWPEIGGRGDVKKADTIAAMQALPGLEDGDQITTAGAASNNDGKGRLYRYFATPQTGRWFSASVNTVANTLAPVGQTDPWQIGDKVVLEWTTAPTSDPQVVKARVYFVNGVPSAGQYTLSETSPGGATINFSAAGTGVQIGLADDGLDVLTTTDNAGGFLSTQSGSLTTTGDLHVHGPTNRERLPVGANGTVLTADSSERLGLTWTAPARVFDTVADAVAATNLITGQLVKTLSYRSAGFGGNTYRFDADSTETPDGGHVIAVTSGGRLIATDRSRCDVASFGVYRDDVNSDSPAIQAAVDTAQARGVDVHFSGGPDYRLAAQINIAPSVRGTRFYGDGQDNTILKWLGAADASAAMFSFGAGTCRRFMFENLTIDGNTAAGYGIRSPTAKGVQYTDARLHQIRILRTTQVAYWISEGHTNTITNCNLQNNGDIGVLLSAPDNDARIVNATFIRGCHIDATDHGVVQLRGRSLTVQDSVIESCGAVGVYANNVEGVSLHGNHMETNGSNPGMLFNDPGNEREKNIRTHIILNGLAPTETSSWRTAYRQSNLCRGGRISANYTNGVNPPIAALATDYLLTFGNHNINNPNTFLVAPGSPNNPSYEIPKNRFYDHAEAGVSRVDPWTGENVRAYGAVGDGAADDTAAINAAVAAAGATKAIHLPVGSYLFNGITLVSNGKSAHAIRPEETTPDVTGIDKVYVSTSAGLGITGLSGHVHEGKRVSIMVDSPGISINHSATFVLADGANFAPPLRGKLVMEYSAVKSAWYEIARATYP